MSETLMLIFSQEYNYGTRYEPRNINPAHIKVAYHDDYHGHVIEFIDGSRIVERDGAFCTCRSSAGRAALARAERDGGEG